MNNTETVIEYAATTQGQADDLLRQATGQILHASAAGRLGWTYTGPDEHVTALARLLHGRGVKYIVS